MNREKIARNIVETFFVVRYWLIIILLTALICLTYWVAHLPNIAVKDVVTVFASGSVVITVFYYVLNYEYTQRKFKYDTKSAKDILSFNTALEWQKEYLVKSQVLARKFFDTHKTLLENNTLKEWQDELEKIENDSAYTGMLSVLNFLESISLGVKQAIMDEEFVKGFFGTLFSMYYNRYITWIHYRRRVKGNQKIWNNFTDLSEKWLSCI